MGCINSKEDDEETKPSAKPAAPSAAAAAPNNEEKARATSTKRFREPSMIVRTNSAKKLEQGGGDGGGTDRGAHHVRNVFATPLEQAALDNYEPPVHAKSHSEVQFISGALKHNFVFDHMHRWELKPLIEAFEKTTFKAGETIIKQGDDGDYFYIIKSGSCAFTVDDKEMGQAGEGDSFGELALLYTSPRAASVKAVGDVELYRVDQKTFRFILQSQTQQGQQDKLKLLKGLEFLKGVSDRDLSKLYHAMTPKVFENGEYLMRKGDKADYFYILDEGTAEATDVGVGDQHYENTLYKAGDCFGERAILTGDPRAANVIAKSDGMAFIIDKETFELVLGDLWRLVLRNLDKTKLSGIKLINDTHLDSAILTTLAALVIESNDLKAGETIITEGQSTDAAIYLVRKGTVNVASSDGKRQDTVIQGGYFGEDMLLADVESGKNSSKDPTTVNAKYSATVLEDCQCGILTLKNCRKVFDTRYFGKGAEKCLQHKASVADCDIPYEQLKRHALLGAGTFGQVWLVSREGSPDRTAYALKIQSKYELYQDGQAKAVVLEKNILSKLDHPFLITLVNTYQDEQFVYMLLQLIQGGELYSVIHTSRRDCIPERDAMFYAAGIADGLAYMHRRGYVYRDLKPENVLIDSDGYPVIVDFGFAKYVTDKTYTLCGTPLYIPPEVILNRGHNWAADHWSLGVLIYEMISGDTPFYMSGMEQMDLFRSIVKCKYDIPRNFTKEASDIVQSILVKDPSKRLGSLSGGESDILDHPWFTRSIDFHALTSKEIKAPHVPKIKDPLDCSNFEDWSHLSDKTKKKYPHIPADQEKIFQEF